MALNVRRVDEFQRRHPFIGFPLAVAYKFFDDQGPYLAAILTYYAFVAIFPIMLIASSVLGFILQGDEELQAQLLDSALRQFPIVGTQLGRPEGLEGSTGAVVIGALAALYGLLGLGQAAQHALNVVWAVPRNSRFNPFVGRWRGFVSMALAGLVVVAVATVSALSGNLGSLGFEVDALLRWIGTVLSVLLTAAVLALMMRYTTAHRPSFRTNLPGALVIAVLWHVLQVAGGEYVRRVVTAASEMNSVFALVLGLVALLFLASSMAVIGLEVSVVRNQRLYPRALLTPFTDAVDLTDADRRAYASYAKAQRHKGFERVEVIFDERGTKRRAAPEESAPPGP
ncbi:YihY/virulence factor BrkB family protein [Nocardioides caldifontis]|uniref:YihY/virulence factor BrkB family protein n=1 Tax=Nocardioides caldifontis TaxID=2588938 RepID=UPI0011DF7475|nr:YihY/virulence factor BrkB family protein [Nocardioides caldifontis]